MRKFIVSIFTLGLLCMSVAAKADVGPIVGGGRGDNTLCTNAYGNFWGVMFGLDGALYLGDTGGNALRRCVPGSIITSVVGNTYLRGQSPDFVQASSAMVTSPLNSTMDGGGTVYFVTGNLVRAISQGILWTAVSGLPSPEGLAVDVSRKKLYVSDVIQNKIYMFNIPCPMQTGCGAGTVIAGTGGVGFTGDNIPATTVKVQAKGLAVCQSTGEIVYSDSSCSRVRKFAVGGNVTTLAGGANGGNVPGYNGDNILATASLLYAPTGVACGNDGTVAIADNFNHRIRVIDPVTKFIRTVIGTGQINNSGAHNLDPQPISYPGGVAIGPNFIVGCSQQDSICYSVDTSGVVTPIASTPTSTVTQVAATLTATKTAVSTSTPVNTVTASATRTATHPPCPPTSIPDTPCPQ